MSRPRDRVMAGCVVLVTADRRSGELASALSRHGAMVRHAPALSIVPHEHDEDLLLGTKQLLGSPADIVVITTGIGFRGWVEAADAAGVADELLDALSGARLIARGPKAHGALQAAGLQPDWVAESATSAEIVARLRSGSMIAAAVGPITAKPLQDKGIEPIIPDRGRLGALVRALVGHYEQAQTTAVTTAEGRLQVRRTVAVLEGHVVPLSPSALEVLRLLANRRGEVVTREQVLAVLPGDSQDPHTAEVAIARLRDVCGGRALIQTVVKRGYRLAVT